MVDETAGDEVVDVDRATEVDRAAKVDGAVEAAIDLAVFATPDIVAWKQQTCINPRYKENS